MINSETPPDLPKKLATNPLIILRLPVDGTEIEAVVGSGSNRVSIYFEDAKIAELLLSLRLGSSLNNAVLLAARTLDTDVNSAKKMLHFLFKSDLLIQPSKLLQGAIRWESSGWRDALDFHLAAKDLAFSDDRLDYSRWASKVNTMVDEGNYPPDPGPSKTYSDNLFTKNITRSSETNLSSSVASVLSSTRPFRSYEADFLRFKDIEYVISETYLPHSWHNSPFGRYYKRASPSGGARHPIEAYLVALNVNGLSPGLYHINTRSESLVRLEEGQFREPLTRICFNKPGIETAGAVIVLTVRWLRHQYKYHYSRSYRMVMLDVGHIIQTHALIASSVGIQCFLGPSIDDDAMKSFLKLESGESEDPIYVIGMGRRLPDDAEGSFFPMHAA